MEKSVENLIEYIYNEKLPDKDFVHDWLYSKPDRLQKMLKYLDTPSGSKPSLSAKQRKQLNITQYYFPELFEKKLANTNEPLQEKLTGSIMPKVNNTVADKINQLGLTGIIKDTGKAVDTALDSGYLPDFRDKNILGLMKEQVTFPLNKLMQTLTLAPRAEAELASQVYQKGIESGEYSKVADFNLQDYDMAAQTKKNINPLNAIKQFGSIGKEGWKEVGKAAFEPLVNTKSEYSNKGFTQLYEEMFPDTKFTKPFEATKDWEGGNWGQRLVSGFAGSPSDIAGLASDIIFDPLTYLSGGLGKGAKTGVSLVDDLVKDGIKVLPKGAGVGLTKAGKTAYTVFEEKLYPNIFKAIEDGLISPNAVVKGLNATDDIAKSTAINVLKNKAYNKFLQEVPDAITLNKYLDKGGTKLLGETIIPGYKYSQLGQKFEKTGLGKWIQKAFNSKAEMPQELRPVFDWLQSAGEAEKKQQVIKFASITENASKVDLDKAQKYLWQMADIERATNKLDDVAQNIFELGDLADIPKPLLNKQNRLTNLISKYTDSLNKLGLDEKQLGLVDNLQDFWKTVADDYVKATGKQLPTYEFYTPIRYVRDETGKIVKSSTLGAETQPFSKAREITMAQADKLGLEPKPLVESSMQRLWEQEKNVFRSRLVNEVKQFGSDVAQDGLIKVEGIPELKNFYLPKEYNNVVKNVKNMFFGDDATKGLLKGYDKGLTVWKRWALATPGYHFRNFFTDNVSGLMEYGINWYNPKHWSDGIAVLKGEHKLITLNGVKRYADDVLKEMVQTGEVGDITMTAIESGLGKGGKLAKNISPAEWSLRFGNKRENLGRVIAGVIERDAGSSKIMSAANVKKVFFDYAHSLTPFEQNIMKRVIPFYTWMKNNLRRQVELLFTRTGEYAAIPKAMNFVENISDVPEGHSEFQEPYKKELGMFATPLRQPGLPDWLANILNKDKTTQAGKMLEFSPNFGFQDWSRLNPVDMLSAASPILKVGLETAFNKNLFYGTPIMSRGDTVVKSKPVALPLQKLLEKAPESIVDNIPGLSKTKDGTILGSGLFTYLMSQLPQYALSQRAFAGTENSPYQNISAGFGLKFAPYDETKAKDQYTQSWLDSTKAPLSDYAQDMGEGYKTPTVTQITSAYRDAYKKAVEDKYAEVLQLRDLLDVVGSNKELDAYVKELLKPFKAEYDKQKGASSEELKKLLKSLGIEFNDMADIEAYMTKQE